MNIFKIIENLFVNKKSDWIHKLNDSDISPFLIQRFLCLHKSSQKASRVLNSFVYTLSPKMYLSAAWSLFFFNVEKLTKGPFIKYPKKEDNKHTYDFLFEKIKKQYSLSDKDIRFNLKFLVADIEKNKEEWFSYYGVSRSIWSQHRMDFNLIKKYGDKKIINKKILLEDFY